LDFKTLLALKRRVSKPSSLIQLRSLAGGLDVTKPGTDGVSAGWAGFCLTVLQPAAPTTSVAPVAVISFRRLIRIFTISFSDIEISPQSKVLPFRGWIADKIA